MGHYDSCYEADEKQKKHFVVVMDYKTPHLKGWGRVEGDSIADVWDKLNNHVLKAYQTDDFKGVYDIDEVKFHFKYV